MNRAASDAVIAPPLRYGSVCSGIEAATVAWHPLGWAPAWFAEIEPFPCAVLAHHYPDVPNLGDMTTIQRRLLVGEVDAPDILCGGTPCQAFSVAGKRESLADARGNLSLTFCEIANAIDHVRAGRGDQPAIIFWENVPGVLSTRDNAFGCFLGALAGAGCELQPAGGRWADAGCVYGPARAVAWRVLDAQYFGLAQRRRRVFVVASARDGFDPGAVLLEFDGVRRDSAPRREAREETASGLAARAGGGGRPDGGDGRHSQLIPEAVGAVVARAGRNGGASNADLDAGHILAFGGNDTRGPIEVSAALGAHVQRQDFESETFIAHTLRGEGFDASEDGTGRGTPLVAVAFAQNQRDEIRTMDIAGALAAEPGAKQQTYVAFSCKDHGADASADVAPTLRAMGSTDGRPNGGGQVAVAFQDIAGTLKSCGGKSGTPNGAEEADRLVGQAMSVRRLTPRECERLQGFPDDYTLIPWRKKPAADCPDGPRYKALGNSWAVPCVRWIGRRIQAVLS